MARSGAPSGASANEGAARIARRDFGLAEEIARVERAARDWGVHVDALEGQFVRALLKAIEETGKTNLATLGDLEALLERAHREGEADRRRIERMIEAGSNALAMADRASENAGVASARAQQMVDEGVAGIQARMSKALVEGCPQWLIFEQTARHRLYAWRLAAWWRLASWRRSFAAASRCNGGVRRRARRARPSSKRSTAVGSSRGWCGRRMAKPLKCVGSRI